MASLIRFAAAFVVALAASAGTASASVIVFAGTTPSLQVDQLFSISPSGADLKQLTTGVHPADAPAFSPNGKRIAFERTGIGIFTMNANGTGLVRLTTNPRDSYPAWSPDGTRIAFVRPVGPQWRVYVIPATGGKARELEAAPPAGRPSWTSAGLLIPSGGDVIKIDPATGRVLKYYGANVDAIWGLNTVAFAPNLGWLTYVGSRAPEPGDMECGEGPCQRFGLYLEDLATKAKRPRLIVKDTGPAAFSPNGKQIVFTSSGKLKLRSLASGASTSIATGTVYPTNAAPPTWR